MDLFGAIKGNNPDALRDALAAGQDPNQMEVSGFTPLQLSTLLGHTACIELLLKQYNIIIDLQDRDGNSALHIAAKQCDFETVKLLLSFGANAFLTTVSGKKPVDLTRDPQWISTHRIERMTASAQTQTLQQARNEMMRQIEFELPNDIPSLKSFSVELLLSNQMFQDRCKETIHQLVEEKHLALHKYRLLENAAGIRDTVTGGNFLSQLQYLQLENEQQAATIAYLKIHNRMLETSISQQEEYYRKNLSDFSDQHSQEMKVMLERSQESEKRFMDVQKQVGEELVALRKENVELIASGATKSGASATPLDSQLAGLVAENSTLQQKLKEIQAEKVAAVERLKSVEQLKALHEQDISKVRSNTNFLQKMMQDAMAKVLTEARNEADERDETSGNIVFVRGENGSKQIKGGTPDKLVERLTDPGTFGIEFPSLRLDSHFYRMLTPKDSQFQAALLLTYRSFMDGHAFLQHLVKRFKDSMVEQGAGGVQNAQSPIQLRVCNTVKTWIENYWSDFLDDKLLLEKLTDFVELIKRHNEKLSNVIKVSLNRKLEGKDAPAEKKAAANAQPRPKPLIPKGIAKRVSAAGAMTSEVSASTLSMNSNREKAASNWGGFNFGKLRIGDEKWGEDIKLKLMDLEPLELARQLTLVEFELFTAIKPTEFLDQAWMKEDKETRAPNICNMTKWSNHVTRWIISEVVSIKDNIKNRALVVERVIMLAQNLEKLNNFNGVKEVLAGLQSSAVYRLKKTREAVGSKYLKIFDDLVKLTSSDLNFKNLRSKIHAADPPLIPFPGVYQGDLVFLDTCSRSKLENGLVNFLKFQKIASYILELQVYQQTPYNLEPVPEIISYLRQVYVLNDDDAYKDSLICEPRGS